MTKNAKGNYPVDPVCPECKEKGAVCEVHTLHALLAVHGVNCRGGILTADLDDKHLLAAEDEGIVDSDEQFECTQCSARFSHKRLIEASLKEGGYPNLMDVSQDFKKFWAEQTKLVGPLDMETEVLAWRAWQTSRESVLKMLPPR
jgi:hypothetical protein